MFVPAPYSNDQENVSVTKTNFHPDDFPCHTLNVTEESIPVRKSSRTYRDLSYINDYRCPNIPNQQPTFIP